MYCKKCKFHSFDHVSACPKCGADWEETRKALYLNWITANGINWVAPAPSAPAAAAKPGAQGVADDDISAIMPPTPEASATQSDDIDAGLFPELDFSMPEAAAEEQIKAPVPQAAPKPPKKAQSDEELFLDAMPVEDMVELDFSASFDAPAEPPAPPVSKPKREDLFIPELEEMLAPLTDEPRSTPAPAKKPAFTEETDILLDFGSAPSNGNGPKSDADDIPLLTLEDTDRKA